MTRARTIANFGDGITDADLPAGSVLQVVQTVKTDTFSGSTTNATDYLSPTGYSVSITPSSASNKILVLAFFNFSATGDSISYVADAKLLRNGSPIFIADSSGSRDRSTIGRMSAPNNRATISSTISYLDDPSTTSTVTYSVGLGADQAATVYLNAPELNDNQAYQALSASSIIAMEIAG